MSLAAKDEHEGAGSSEGKKDDDEMTRHLAMPLSQLQHRQQVAGSRRRFDSADWAMDLAGDGIPTACWRWI